MIPSCHLSNRSISGIILPSPSPSLSSPLRLRPLFFLRRPRLQLQRMNATLPTDLLLQQRIHHAMPRRLRLARKRRRHHRHGEMRLLGRHALHRRVVRVQVRVVAHGERRGGEGG